MAVAFEVDIIYDAVGNVHNFHNVILTTYLWPNVILMVVLVVMVVVLMVVMVPVILMVLDDETFIGEILWRRVEARQVAGES